MNSKEGIKHLSTSENEIAKYSYSSQDPGYFRWEFEGLLRIAALTNPFVVLKRASWYFPIYRFEYG